MNYKEHSKELINRFKNDPIYENLIPGSNKFVLKNKIPTVNLAKIFNVKLNKVENKYEGN